MQGETDLNNLLENISPKLLGGEYVFCTVKTVFTEIMRTRNLLLQFWRMKV